MCRMGCPEVIITDQGREFVNSLSAQLYQITNTQHIELLALMHLSMQSPTTPLPGQGGAL